MTSPAPLFAERTISGETVLVDVVDLPLLDGPAQVVRSNTRRYVRISVGERTVALARAIMNAPEGMVVDHISGNTFDNRRSNLRLCTMQQNNWNRCARPGAVSRFKGVSKTRHGRWIAFITVGGKRHRLGLHPDEEAAARAFDAAAREKHGRFARLNFPRLGEQSALPAGAAPVSPTSFHAAENARA